MVVDGTYTDQFVYCGGEDEVAVGNCKPIDKMLDGTVAWHPPQGPRACLWVTRTTSARHAFACIPEAA